jgi:hypothetical protein
MRHLANFARLNVGRDAAHLEVARDPLIEDDLVREQITPDRFIKAGVELLPAVTVRVGGELMQEFPAAAVKLFLSPKAGAVG